jgi:hypothetical protein
MIRLWRKTIELLRKNPALWLPYLVAELMAIGLWRLWGVVRTSIFHWFTTRHSVLGGELPVPSTDYSAPTKASFVTLPIGFVVVFAVVCLFVVALMTTAWMVDAINREQKTDVRGILAGVLQRWKRILLFTLLSLVAFGASMGGVGALLFFVLYLAHRPDLRTSHLSALGMSPVFVGCATWVLVPMAIRLLRADKTIVVAFRARNIGAITAILAVVAGALLDFFLWKAEGRVQLDMQFERWMLAAFNSVVANAPDVVLFVGIALLAADYSHEMDGGGVSKVRALLQAAMPMHFRETNNSE